MIDVVAGSHIEIVNGDAKLVDGARIYYERVVVQDLSLRGLSGIGVVLYDSPVGLVVGRLNRSNLELGDVIEAGEPDEGECGHWRKLGETGWQQLPIDAYFKGTLSQAESAGLV